MEETVRTVQSRYRSPTDSVDWLRVGALCGLSLDAVTTGYVLATDSYRELNPVLTDLWTIHPGVVTGYFLCFLAVVWLTTRRAGWLSTAISSTVIVVMGVFGGLNNLALFVFGSPSILEWMASASGLRSATLIVTGVPLCGLAVGLLAVRFRHNQVPWRAVGVAVGVGVVGYLVFLRTAMLFGGTSAVVL